MGHHPAHRLPFGLCMQMSLAQMPTAPRFLRAICRAYSIGIRLITLRTSSRFSDAFNNAHKRSRSPSQTHATEGILVENASPAAIKSSLQVLSGHNSNTWTGFPPSCPKHHSTCGVDQTKREERRAEVQIQNRISG